MQTVEVDRTATATATTTTTNWVRISLVAGLVTVLALDYRAIVSAVTNAVIQAVGASAGWLTIAAGSAAASMIAFGLLRQRTIAAGGGTLGIREAVAVSYAAGAIHLTTPGGVVLSTTYVFRRLQRRHLQPATIAWSVTVSGVLSTVTLMILGVAGFAAGRTSDALEAFLPALAMTLLVTATVIALGRRADLVARLVVRGLRMVNRVVRRPADAGVLTAQALITDLRSIRPAPMDWLTSTGAAIANWLLDLLCLWACAQALGIHIAPWLLLTSFALAMAGAGVSPLPGGVGVVESILVFALAAGAHVPVGTAIGAVLLYRVISLGSLLAIGWLSIGMQSVRTRSRSHQAPVSARIPALH
ncbi:MAG: lysylphosphatidylglycerol synthase transmembrane domain-containing protein [Nakamurella sp.]